MRIIVPIIAIIILAAPAAMAGHPWSGAGWYHVIEVSAAGRRILKTLTGGPFADESSCLANLPRDYTSPGDDAGDPDEFNDYSCLFLSSRPDWDD